MNASVNSELARLELYFSKLVHPDWLPILGVEFTTLPIRDGSPKSIIVAISRHLIEEHRLEPLHQGLFTHDWTYSAIGGQDAIRALTSQLTTYFMSTWVQAVVSGVQVRDLRSQLGEEVYKHVLRHQKPLRAWSAPKSIPPDLPDFLFEQSQALMDALWRYHTPGLTPWAILMSARRQRFTVDTAALSEHTMHLQAPYSQELLVEIDRRLQVDFEIDVAAVFNNSALKRVS